MSKLYFYYGVMGSAKTTQLLTTNFSYNEKSKKTILFTPEVDTRKGKGIISSRIGIEAPAIVFSPQDDLYDLIYVELKNKGYASAVLVDEAQFLTEAQVDQLANAVDFFNIDVLSYGLRTDFKSKTFEGSKRLLELSDNIQEIKILCHCGRKAIINARYVNGKVSKVGSQILIGDTKAESESIYYAALCRKCWNQK